MSAALYFENFVQDLRFGSRVLLKQPGSLISAVAALTLGIGLVTFMFCGIDTVLFQTLPYADPNRLVYTSIPGTDFREVSEQQTTFEGLSAFDATSANFRAAGLPSRRNVCFITANFLDLLRVTPFLGRGFLPEEDSPGAAPGALLSYTLWQEEFNGDRAALGSTIHVDGEAKTVVWIMPPEFKFPIREELWIASSARGGADVFGRLKPASSQSQARAELNLIATRLAALRNISQAKLKPVRVGAFTDGLLGGFRTDTGGEMAMVIFGMALATFFVLFIACANVAILTLARASKRGAELAVRGALGASRHRLVSQMLSENLILTACGTVGGAIVATGLNKWVESDMAGKGPFDLHLSINWHVLLFLILLTLLVNLLAGLAPALQATKRDVNDLLKDQASASSSLRVTGFQRFLIVSQVSMSVTILVGTAVLAGSSRWMNQMHLPFDPASTWTGKVEYTAPGDPHRFFQELDRNLGGNPGIGSVALTSQRLSLGWARTSIELEGKSYPRPEDHPDAAGRIVSPGFFHALNLPLLEGRGFGPEDRPGSMRVAVVNATFAKQYLPSGSPLGRRFRENPERRWTTDGAWLTVVGYVPDVLYGEHLHEPGYFMPMSQRPCHSMVVMLRGHEGRGGDVIRIVREEVSRLEPDLPVFGIETVRSWLDEVDNGLNGACLLSGICGVGALFLASLGIFGLIALSVSQRTREIGIRLALGATRGGVMFTVLHRALWQIAFGLVAGALLAMALVRAIGSAVPTPPHQSWLYFAAICLMGIVSLIAVLTPARRAAKVDPMTALRCE